MVTLETDRLRLSLEPTFGARVTELWDKRTGRNWLVCGACEGSASRGADYGAKEARGWDECFPTVRPCWHPAWGHLRNHGELWGRAWEATWDEVSVSATWEDRGVSFSRTIKISGAVIEANYRLANLRASDLPWMWSQHCLLAARPGERVLLDGFQDHEAEGQTFEWPHHLGRDLSRIGNAKDGFALKTYARAAGPAQAAVVGDRGGIAFHWHGASVPALGIWLDWGGWPKDNPVHQLAIEPTTAPADDLVAAGEKNKGSILAPGETATWTIAIALIDADR